MNDAETTLAEIRDAIRAFNAARDWGRYHSPRNLSMALCVEAAELMELYLWAADDGPQPPVPERIPRVAQEAADVAICLLNLCEHADIDLGRGGRGQARRQRPQVPCRAGPREAPQARRVLSALSAAGASPAWPRTAAGTGRCRSPHRWRCSRTCPRRRHRR